MYWGSNRHLSSLLMAHAWLTLSANYAMCVSHITLQILCINCIRIAYQCDAPKTAHECGI